MAASAALVGFEFVSVEPVLQTPGCRSALHFPVAEHVDVVATPFATTFIHVAVNRRCPLMCRTHIYACFLCCAVRGDLVRILHKLLERRAKFDYIIIETTGLADPAPVAQTFFVDEGLQQHLKLDAIVTVVDAKHVHQHLDEKKPEGVENEVSPNQLSPAPGVLLPFLHTISVSCSLWSSLRLPTWW